MIVFGDGGPVAVKRPGTWALWLMVAGGALLLEMGIQATAGGRS